MCVYRDHCIVIRGCNVHCIVLIALSPILFFVNAITITIILTVPRYLYIYIHTHTYTRGESTLTSTGWGSGTTCHRLKTLKVR